MTETVRKRTVHRNEPEQFNSNENLTSIFSSNHRTFILIIGSVLFTAMFTFFAMIYWCARHQRRWKTDLHSSSVPVNSTDRPFFALVPEHIQPMDNHAHAELLMTETKRFQKKNLLERRGSNNTLKLSITSKHRTINSPPREHASDEYLQTATRKLTINELHQDAQDISRLCNEFWTIPTNHLEKLRICGAGTKNRYGTIIANEHSRVQLPELFDDPVSSYINANYVRGWPNEEHAYIATQGPLMNTIMDFYRMIWQENVPVIVMITRLLERNKSKCERYIPDGELQQYGKFFVKVKSVNYENDYEIRRLVIEADQEQRELDHYWYTAWPDQSCPEIAEPLIELVHRVERSRNQLNELNQHSGPVVVHCSAGIGRTGCFIALSNGIKQLDAERVVDVVRILCNLRQDRGGMIQTHDQYQFLYQALSRYARRLPSG